jgi:hypothetical protein
MTMALLIIGGLMVFSTLILGHLLFEIEKAKGFARKMLADGKSLGEFVAPLWDEGFFAQQPIDFGISGAIWEAMLSRGADWPAIIDIELQSTKASYMTPQWTMGTILFVVVVMEGIFVPIAFAISVALLFVLPFLPQGEPSTRRAKANLASLCWLIYHFNKDKPVECKRFIEKFTEFENLCCLSTELKARAQQASPTNESALPDARLESATFEDGERAAEAFRDYVEDLQRQINSDYDGLAAVMKSISERIGGPIIEYYPNGEVFVHQDFVAELDKPGNERFAEAFAEMSRFMSSQARRQNEHA